MVSNSLDLDDLVDDHLDDVGDEYHDEMTQVINDFEADAVKLPGFTVYDGWSTRHLYTHGLSLPGRRYVMLSYACMLSYAMFKFAISCSALLCYNMLLLY